MEKSRILVVAAHPDDEVLGCAGTLARSIQQGAKAYLLILGEGVASRYNSTSDKRAAIEIKKLNNYTLDASRVVGAEEIFNFKFPDNRFDTVSLLDIVKAVEEVKKKVRPTVVFTHFWNDLNIDHRVTYGAVLTAFRPLHNETAKKIYSFEVPSSTEWSSPEAAFLPNVFVDISGTIEQKVKAMQSYKSEVRKWPHPRSTKAIRIWAQKRGSEAGLGFAEAFKLVREIK